MRAASLLAFSPLLLASFAAGQAIEYDLTPLGLVPEAYSTVGTGLNDRGDVVGWSQFFGGDPGVRAWHWSAEKSFTPLPDAPGLANTRAIDVNNAGVIAGDGAYDSGVAWRFEDGTYTLLGTLPGDGRSIAYMLNEAGEVAGTSWAFTFAIPKKAVVSRRGEPLLRLTEGEATAVNALGQVAGWHTGFAPYRYTPGVGIENLPLVPGKSYHYPWGINERGDVVGRATHANGNGSVPFIFTDDGGSRQIGNFGGSASAVSINGHGQVVGNYRPSGGGQPWIWDEARGLRFLHSLIDSSLGYSPYDAVRINERGEILVRAYSNAHGGFQPVLLTPREPSQPGLAYCLGEGACACGEDRLAGCANSTGAGARLAATGSASVAADDLVLRASGLPPHAFGIVFAGPTAIELPFGDGQRCVGGPLVRFPLRSADAAGDLAEGPAVLSWVGAASGDTQHFQCWYRDPMGCTGAAFNLSNGYEVLAVP